VTLGPCASNTPHTHPRGSEISFLLYGEIEFGMVEENAGNNTLVMINMKKHQTVHIPQGACRCRCSCELWHLCWGWWMVTYLCRGLHEGVSPRNANLLGKRGGAAHWGLLGCAAVI